MKIFKEIKDSIVSEEFYKSLPTGRSLSSSIKYLAKLCLLTSLVSMLIVAFFMPVLYTAGKAALDDVAENYPEDLVVTLKDGNASINRAEPFILPLSESAKKDIEEGDEEYKKYENLLVIDTVTPFSLEQFEKYSTLAWMTKTEIVGVKSNGEIQILPLSRFGNWEINKAWVSEKETLLIKLLPWFMVAMIILFYMGYFVGTFVGSLIMLFFYALVIWLMAKIKKVPLSYKDSYKIGIHAKTLPIILGIISFGLFHSFFIKLIIVMVVVYLNFFRNSANTSGAMPASSSPMPETNTTPTTTPPPTQM